MSGFGGFGSSGGYGGVGGGFGSNNSQQGLLGSFGQSPTISHPPKQQQQQPGFGGSGFGAAAPAVPFGNPPPSTSSSSMATFSAPAPPSTGFGSSPNVITGPGGGGSSSSGFDGGTGFGGGFGNNSNNNNATGFGNANSGFGSGNSKFGSGNSGGGTAFAGSNSGFGISSGSGFGNSINGDAFGSSTIGGGFGSTPAPVPASGRFGSNPLSGFGSSSNTGAAGISSGTGFGTSSSMAASSSNPPFGNTAQSSGFGSSTSASAPSSGMTFGSSANVTTGPKPSGGFSQPSHTMGTASGWNSNPSSSDPFGTSQGSGIAVSKDDGMMDAFSSFRPAFGSGNTSSGISFGRSSNIGGRKSFQPSASPVPEETEMGDGDDEDEETLRTSNNDSRGDQEAKLKAKIEEKKRLLQAKLEEKKKRMLEKQRQQQNRSPTQSDDEGNGSPSPPPPSLNPDAKSFVPSSSSSQDQKSLAERNALRFGDQANERSKTHDMLPPEMRAKVEGSAPASRASAGDSTSEQQGTSGREELDDAKSLEGTCEFFCPDEELLRRERESDIQQLEIPMPGKLHPTGWTLRNTAVKRFRRSAADYKLDVPEWVRPPDVLERVCGYLEEWVMERDRQGPDPRIPQGQTPPSLEVYQFIWDRTRMIRKDLTLQNYVGTGGKCDARAVRCHERIARWHAMCEHQLSHIQDFTTMQSQQNIQELGQTMKTLNHFYDDSLSRATVEVPDESGKETQTNLSGLSHGCTSDNVQGEAPIDFDGTELNNSANGKNISQRIIGKHAVNRPSHGTAEPEMRGLYILLTMNNEGGMEVLKYAARLFQDRPEIYHSKPVQLALDIFKAKKEYNYARFFSILRSPNTPYLFCCVMFKHVELMRKIAFRIMNKAFGARKKDTGEAIYDSYPLNRLVELLCFEGLDEARTACQHYNITVKQVKVSSSHEEVADVIFWRQSDFREPTHPEKGFVLPLPPRKMTRTIEKKLNGATRLAVCRGEVSGEGATLQSVHATDVTSTSAFQSSAALIEGEDDARVAAIHKRQEVEMDRLQRQAEVKDQEQRRVAKEEEEARRKKEGEEERAKEMERQRVEQVLEEEKRRKEALEAQRMKEEAEKRAAEERAKEDARKRAEEAEARRKEEEARRKADEERKRANEARRQEEEARKERERQERILEEKRRVEEARRQEQFRLELEARRKKEEEERRKAKEWEEEVNNARRIVLWKRWKKRVARSIEMTHGSAKSLKRLDPTFSSHTLELGTWFKQARKDDPYAILKGRPADAPPDMRREIEACIKKSVSKLSLSDMAIEEMVSTRHEDMIAKTGEAQDESKYTLLLKVCVIIPSVEDGETESMANLLKIWLKSRLSYGKVLSTQSEMSGRTKLLEARSIVQLTSKPEDCLDCDVALVVVPPPWSTSQARRTALECVTSILDDSVPRVALVLGDFDHEGHEYMNKVVADCLGSTISPLPIICNRNVASAAFDKALELSCRKVAAIFVRDVCVKVTRMSIPKLAYSAVSTLIWDKLAPHAKADGNAVLEHARSAITTLIEQCDARASENEAIWSTWPPGEFVSEDGVEDYFAKGSSLPACWKSSIRKERLEKELLWMRHRLTGSFLGVIDSFLHDAPEYLKEECTLLFTKGSYRRSLQTAMEAFASHTRNEDIRYVFFPRGFLGLVLEEVAPENRLDDSTVPTLLMPKDFAILEAAESLDEGPVDAALLAPPGSDDGDSLVLPPRHNKRRRSELACDMATEEASWPEASKKGSSKKLRPTKEQRRTSNTEVAESSAFSKRLKGLMNGGTVDLQVGDHYLSSILRNVPKLNRD